MRNVMPLSVTVPFAAVLAIPGGQFVALGDLLVFGGFFALSYAAYDLGHWMLHQRTSSNRLFRYLQRHHLRHHYASVDGNFSVTVPIWDFVFGTRIVAGGGRRKAAARSLM
jgi:sterol desaturase/sphingolipid hydroxylase (fatty acid hydroxylase superfamily)